MAGQGHRTLSRRTKFGPKPIPESMFSSFLHLRDVVSSSRMKEYLAHSNNPQDQSVLKEEIRMEWEHNAALEKRHDPWRKNDKIADFETNRVILDQLVGTDGEVDSIFDIDDPALKEDWLRIRLDMFDVANVKTCFLIIRGDRFSKIWPGLLPAFGRKTNLMVKCCVAVGRAFHLDHVALKPSELCNLKCDAMTLDEGCQVNYERIMKMERSRLFAVGPYILYGFNCTLPIQVVVYQLPAHRVPIASPSCQIPVISLDFPFHNSKKIHTHTNPMEYKCAKYDIEKELTSIQHLGDREKRKMRRFDIRDKREMEACAKAVNEIFGPDSVFQMCFRVDQLSMREKWLESLAKSKNENNERETFITGYISVFGQKVNETFPALQLGRSASLIKCSVLVGRAYCCNCTSEMPTHNALQEMGYDSLFIEEGSIQGHHLDGWGDSMVLVGDHFLVQSDHILPTHIIHAKVPHQRESATKHHSLLVINLPKSELKNAIANTGEISLKSCVKKSPYNDNPYQSSPLKQRDHTIPQIPHKEKSATSNIDTASFIVQDELQSTGLLAQLQALKVDHCDILPCGHKSGIYQGQCKACFEMAAEKLDRLESQCDRGPYQTLETISERQHVMLVRTYRTIESTNRELSTTPKSSTGVMLTKINSEFAPHERLKKYIGDCIVENLYKIENPMLRRRWLEARLSLFDPCNSVLSFHCDNSPDKIVEFGFPPPRKNKKAKVNDRLLEDMDGRKNIVECELLLGRCYTVEHGEVPSAQQLERNMYDSVILKSKSTKKPSNLYRVGKYGVYNPHLILPVGLIQYERPDTVSDSGS